MAEDVRDSSLILTPASGIYVWIRPHYITKHASIRDFYGSAQIENILRIFQVGTQTSMNAKDLLLDDGSNGHWIEYVWKLFPKFEIILSLAYLTLNKYIHRRTHIFYWRKLINGFLWVKKSFMGVLVYKRGEDKCIRLIVCLDQHSRLKTGSYFLLETLSIKRGAISPRTAHEYLQQF